MKWTAKEKTNEYEYTSKNGDSKKATAHTTKITTREEKEEGNMGLLRVFCVAIG